MIEDDDRPIEEIGEIEAAKRKRAAELGDVLDLMKRKEGRRLVWRMLGRARVFQQSWVEGSFDGTAFNEGLRSFGLWLYAEIIEAAPDLVVKMEKEARNG